MKKRVGQFFLSLILILSLSACNLQLVESSDDEGIFLTMTANALIIEQAGQPVQTEPPAQEQIVVVVTATGEAGAAAPPPNEQVNPAQVLPPAAGDVTVTVTTATNCRKGPGQNFGIVYGMPVGQVAKVIAKNSYSGYWIIEIPGQAGQTCWLWGQYAVINGDTSTLKEVVTPTSPAPTSTNTPKPTATPTNTSAPVVTAPNPPSNLQLASFTCAPSANPGFTNISGLLTWTDNANNEINYGAGISLFVDVLLPSNSTSWQFNYDIDHARFGAAAQKVTFNVGAIGVNNSISPVISVDATCP